MTLTEARDAVRRGAFYADVFVRIDEPDRDELARWYTGDPGVPNLAARQPVVARPRLAEAVGTGDGCPRCGGLMVRTGTCLTCQMCGTSSGGCG